MHLGRFLCVAALAALLATAVFARPEDGKVRYDDHAAVRVYPTSLEQARDISQLGVLMSEAESLRHTDYVLPPDALAKIDDMGVRYEVLHPNVQELIDAEAERIASAPPPRTRIAWFEEYKTNDEINAFLDGLIASYPNLIEKEQIGSSVQSQPIYGYTISGPTGDPDAKPGLAFNGMLHSREWISPMTMAYIINDLLTNYGGDPDVTTLMDNMTFYIVVVANPDGYEYSWDTDRYWRKNRRNNGGGYWGVDLNRNWDINFGGQGASSFPGDDTYHGPSAFSEPETQAVRDFFTEHPNVSAHIDFHSYSQLILRPWGYDYIDPPEPDNTIMTTLGDSMRDAILASGGVYYVSQPSYDLYPASGGCSDWFYSWGAYSWTFELRPDSAFPGFELPADEIIPTGEEIVAAVRTLAFGLLQGVQWTLAGGAPDYVSSDGTTTLTIQVVSITSGELDESSATLHYRLGESGSFSEIPMTWLGGSTYEADFPAAPCGATLQYFVSIDADSGESYTTPLDAPASVYETLVQDVSIDYTMNFETPTGWTVDNDPGLDDGAWNFGVPVNCDRGDPPADADGSGSAALTDNSAASGCNSDVDGGATTLVSPVMDASDPDVAIEYYRWYSNSYGSNPGANVFTVEVSDDGGSTWSELETVGPTGSEVNGGWYYKSFVVADIPDITNTSAFRIRFTASDIGSGAVVEAGVDGVTLVALGCEEPSYDLTGDGVVNSDDLFQMLGQWGSCGGCSADFNGDGVVDSTDLFQMLGAWG